MNFELRFWFMLICVIVVAALVRLFFHYFSAEARRNRRRRRSNLRVANKVRRPTIKFSVRTRKKRK